MLASTDLIARMDADDICHPERIAKQYDYLKNNTDCGMVSCSVRVVDENLKLIRIDNFKSEYYYYNQTFICWIYHPTVVFRKTVVEDVGMYKSMYSEDFELFWQISRKYKFYNLPEILLEYRVTSQSLHQVLKKEEYNTAQLQQLQRNLQYYCGEEYRLPIHFLEALLHNFHSLEQRKSPREIIKLLRELDFISFQITEKPNINLDREAVKKAAFYKKKYILNHFLFSLPFFQNLTLRILMGNYGSAIRFVFGKEKSKKSI
jgi:hypothetical protein